MKYFVMAWMCLACYVIGFRIREIRFPTGRRGIPLDRPQPIRLDRPKPIQMENLA